MTSTLRWCFAIPCSTVILSAACGDDGSAAGDESSSTGAADDDDDDDSLTDPDASVTEPGSSSGVEPDTSATESTTETSTTESTTAADSTTDTGTTTMGTVAMCMELKGECEEPADDCVCVGCVDDGTCDGQDDCLCADCGNAAFCPAEACSADGVCDPWVESCGCGDCIGLALCDGFVPLAVVTVGPGADIAIPDDEYDGTLDSMACATFEVVADGTDTVVDVQIDLAMSHPFIGDLVLKLVSPTGTVVTLMSVPGGDDLADDGTDWGGDDSNLVITSPITFVEGGETDAELMGATIVGGNVCVDDGLCEYAPNAGAATPGSLATFVGEDSVGEWRFCAGDGMGGDFGTLDTITLTIEQSA